MKDFTGISKLLDSYGGNPQERFVEGYRKGYEEALLDIKNMVYRQLDEKVVITKRIVEENTRYLMID